MEPEFEVLNQPQPGGERSERRTWILLCGTKHLRDLALPPEKILHPMVQILARLDENRRRLSVHWWVASPPWYLSYGKLLQVLAEAVACSTMIVISFMYSSSLFPPVQSLEKYDSPTQTTRIEHLPT